MNQVMLSGQFLQHFIQFTVCGSQVPAGDCGGGKVGVSRCRDSLLPGFGQELKWLQLEGVGGGGEG